MLVCWRRLVAFDRGGGIRCTLAPARHRDTEQEGHQQARQRGFPGDGADGGEWFAALLRGRNGQAQPVNGGLKGGGNICKGARHLSRRVDGAFGHAGLRGRLRCFDIQCSNPRSPMRLRPGLVTFMLAQGISTRPPPLAIRA